MKKIIKGLMIFLILVIIIILSINLIVIITTKNKIKEIENIELKNIDCVLVLGAGIKNNEPSPMWEEK